MMMTAPTKPMEILAATLRDLGPLRQLEHTCFAGDAWPLLDLVAVLTWPDVVRYKAVMDGKMIGFIAGDTRRMEGIAWIATIAVLPEHRRRGIGRTLLQVCEQRLPTARIRLCVRAENSGAIRLYESEDYRQVDIWRKYYHDSGDALVMEKIRERPMEKTGELQPGVKE